MHFYIVCTKTIVLLRSFTYAAQQARNYPSTYVSLLNHDYHDVHRSYLDSTCGLESGLRMVTSYLHVYIYIYIYAYSVVYVASLGEGPGR